jgi:probable addiction module antidote protein
MNRKTRPFSEIRQERLLIPEVAAEYLNVAKSQSQEIFLKALRRVAQARQMTAVAKEAGIQRETLYHALSEIGNPTIETFGSVLSALGLDFDISAKKKDDSQNAVLGYVSERSGILPTTQKLSAPIILSGSPSFTSDAALQWTFVSGTFGFAPTPRETGAWTILKEPERQSCVYEDRQESLVA